MRCFCSLEAETMTEDKGMGSFYAERGVLDAEK